MIFTVFSKEERTKLEAIDAQELEALRVFTDIRQKNGADSPEAIAAKKEYTEGAQERKEAFALLLEDFKTERFSKLKTPLEILEDAGRQAQDAIIYSYVRIKPDFDHLKKTQPETGQGVVSFGSHGFGYYPLGWDYEAEFLEQKKAHFIPSKSPVLFDTAAMCDFILNRVVDKHKEALEGKAAGERLPGFISEIVNASPYTVSGAAETVTELIPPDSVLLDTYMPMYHGKVTEFLAGLTSQDLLEGPGPDTAIATADGGEFKLVIHGYKDLKGSLGVNTHKLLCVSIAEFTHINNYGGGIINAEIMIPFKDYARALGYEIDERPTTTKEEATKEKNRVRETLKNARKRITKDLNILHSMELTWTEKIKGKPQDFRKMWLIEEVAIEKGYIKIAFTPRMSGYLGLLPLTQYPKSLLGIDARSENAYRLGLKMAQHYNIDNNQRKGTATRLKVSSLLAATQLPAYEKLKTETNNVSGKTTDNSSQWRQRIKEPFETALDVLTGKVICNWEYVGPKGRILTDYEAESIEDYYTFADLYLQFELIEAPDHIDRLARREEEITAAAKEKEKREKNKAKKAPREKKAEA